MRYLVAALIVALALTSCGKRDSKPEIVDTLTIATGPAGGTWAGIGEQLAPVFESQGYGLKSMPGGGVDNILAVSRGDADMGLTLAFLGRRAGQGLEPFDKPVSNVRTLGNLYPQCLFAMVNAGYARRNGIHTFRDLFQGQKLRLAMLERGSASEVLARRAIEACGETVASVTMKGGVLYLDYSTGFQKLLDGSVDAFVFTISAKSKSVYDACSMCELMLLPTDLGIIRQLKEELGTTSYALPAEFYPSQLGEVRMVSDYTCVVVRDDMPEQTAFTITGALVDGWEGLDGRGPALPRIELDEIFEESGFKLHPGASRWFAEKSEQL